MGGSFFFYRPPVNSLRLLQKLDELEHVGRRWWPTLSGAYLIVGQKMHMASLNARQIIPGSQRRVTRALNTMKTGPATSPGER